MKFNFTLLLLAAGIIANAQNVGIGTTTPTKAGLQVDKAVGATYAMFGSQTTGVAIEAGWPGIGLNTYYNGGRKYIANGYGGLISMDPVSGGISFYVSNSGTKDGSVVMNTGLKVFPSGNVGIGTNPSGEAPLTVLEQASKVAVFGNAAELDLFRNTGIYLKTGSYYTGALMTLGENTQTARLSLLTFSSTDHTQLKERLSIMDDGNVGIGTNNPLAKLQVNGSFKLVNGSQGTNKVLVSDATGLATWQNRYDATGYMSLYFYKDGRFGAETLPTSNSRSEVPWTTIVNVGNVWNATTRTYTAPRTGYYEFSYRIDPSATSSSAEALLTDWYAEIKDYNSGSGISGTLSKTDQYARFGEYGWEIRDALITHDGIMFLNAGQSVELVLTSNSSRAPSNYLISGNNYFVIKPQ